MANAAIEASEESSLELSEVTVKLDKVEQDEDRTFVPQPFTVSVKETGEILDTDEVTIPKTSRMTVSPQGDGGFRVETTSSQYKDLNYSWSSSDPIYEIPKVKDGSKD